MSGRFYTNKTNFHVQNCLYLDQHLSSCFQRNGLSLTAMEVKTTLTQDCSNCNTTCSLHVIHHQPLQRVSPEVKHVRSCYCVLLKIHVTSQPVTDRFIKHRPVPGRESSGARTGIGRFLKARF